MIKPIAAVKKLSVSLTLAPDLPFYAVGDEKRLMQTLLNVAGNAVKFTKEGYISITAAVPKPDSFRDPRAPEFYPVAPDGHFYLRVQVHLYPNTWHCSAYSLQGQIIVVETVVARSTRSHMRSLKLDATA